MRLVAVRSNLFTSSLWIMALESRISAVRRRNTVFSAMKDLGNLSRNHCSYHRRYVPFLHEVIELDNFSCGRFTSLVRDTTVCVFSFPKIHHTVHPFLSLNHISQALPFHFSTRIEFIFELNAAIDFLSLPASKSKDVIVERTSARGLRI